MSSYMIKGKVPLKGEVRISGAKNAVLGILAAAIMADETVTVENVPDVNDSNVVLEALADIGAKVKHTSCLLYTSTPSWKCRRT